MLEQEDWLAAEEPQEVRVQSPTFREESCGQCVPCRVGMVHQEELLHRLITNNSLGTLLEACRGTTRSQQGRTPPPWPNQ
jgi:NADH:ubiquinone oxidoreductase subunit F (NADH-binding)